MPSPSSRIPGNFVSFKCRLPSPLDGAKVPWSTRRQLPSAQPPPQALQSTSMRRRQGTIHLVALVALSQLVLAADPAPLVSAAELALNHSLPLVWTTLLPPTSDSYLNATASRSFLVDNWNLSSGTAASLSFVPNPVSEGESGPDGLVLAVDYPVGTRAGVQFHMSPFANFTSVQTAVLSYQVSPVPRRSWGRS